MLCSCLIFSAPAARAQDAPQQQQPPAPAPAPSTPPIPKPTVQLPPPSAQPGTPPPARRVEDRDTGGDAISIEPLYWLTKTSPDLKVGHGNTDTIAGQFSSLPSSSKYALDGVITIPTSRENSLQFSYFRVQGAGDTTIPNTIDLFGGSFAGGDALSSAWKVQDYKLSWNYLTYPYPSNHARFRFKTLWELQYVQVNAAFNAPADVNAIPTAGSKKVFLPTLGAGLEYHAGPHFRLQAKASGFGIPHHSAILDAEGSAVLRFGQFEASVGEKAFYFKTSPQADWSFSQMLSGPFVALRFIWK